MKYIIDSQVVLLRAPEGSLEADINRFAGSLRKQGYALDSIHRQVLIAACFSRWLKYKGVASRRLASEHPARYLRYRARRARPSQGDAAALSHLLAFLRDEGTIPAEKISTRQLTPAEQCTANELYLREVRGLAKETIFNCVRFIRRFLTDRFGDGALGAVTSVRQ
jgi:hypothetical protein